MKICAYVQEAYAKQTYKNECLDARQFVGLRVVIDCLTRAGYEVEWAGLATVHTYDVVLVSLTSDCDWWSYIEERRRWRTGDYKVLIGGAGVLHVAPFLRFFDAAMLGRGENLIVPLVKGIEDGDEIEHESILWANRFDPDSVWRIAQVDKPYEHTIDLPRGKKFAEGTIGCNHHCLFCGYTWQRKFVSPYDTYRMEDGLFGNIADKERAMLDLHDDPGSIDFAHLRTTAIDGMSERIRKAIGKPITRQIMTDFLRAMITSDAKPHQIKIYNIVGYPTETTEDWMEFVQTLREADGDTKADKQWSIALHNTPFRAMPATPMACAPMSKRNYRGEIARAVGKELKGGLLYQGNNLWSVETSGTESLPTVMLSAIAHRGSVDDGEAVERLCATPKFWRASAAVKEATLTRYFDMDTMFGAFTPETLPSRYLRTYLTVEKAWGRTPLEVSARAKQNDRA